MIKRLLISIGLALSFTFPALAQKNVVETVKADLIARGVNLKGACGAAQIAVRVAFQMKYGLLQKVAGNRAVFRANGTCVDDSVANANEPGFATDYLIEPGTFFGYDILGDGGGKNDPQWPDNPETTEVERNKKNFAMAPNLDGVVIPPHVPPEPAPPVVNTDVKKRLDALEKVFQNLTNTVETYHAETLAQIAELKSKVLVLEQHQVPTKCTVTAFGYRITCKLE